VNQATTQGAAVATSAAPEFAAVWERPDDDRRFWERDRMHFPEQITVLDDVLVRLIFEHGFNWAAEQYALPVRAAGRRFSTYMYQSMAPCIPPEQMEAQGKLAEERVNPAIANIGELWEREWFPEVRRYLADWQAYDLAGASLPDLLDHLDEAIGRGTRLWEIHFLLAFPMLLALSLFDDFYRDLFGDEDAFQAFRLLQGFDNKTLESNRALWRLSRRVLAEPRLRQVFEGVPVPEIVPALEQTTEGRVFLTELRTFLVEFGRRGDSWGLRLPGWIEDPTSVIRHIKDYTAQPERDLDAGRS